MALKQRKKAKKVSNEDEPSQEKQHSNDDDDSCVWLSLRVIALLVAFVNIAAVLLSAFGDESYVTDGSLLALLGVPKPIPIRPSSATPLTIPVIDISPFLEDPVLDAAQAASVAQQINAACTSLGFFYVSNHSVSKELQDDLERLSAKFFKLPLSTKNKIRMSLAGRAWRGYFPLEGELTSGKADLKEGIYFGTEHESTSEAVLSGRPMHGTNLFLTAEDVDNNDEQFVNEFKQTVTQYMHEVTLLGHAVMRGVSTSLGLSSNYFEQHFMYDPVILFRIFNYPRNPYPTSLNDEEDEEGERWGVGEHTDYGVLTLLKQDSRGGLQVRTVHDDWVEATPIDNTFVVNIGDMLETLTHGYYISTPHRVKAHSAAYDRLSFPLFFDPAWDATMHHIEVFNDAITTTNKLPKRQRWDGKDLKDVTGMTYGDYLLEKVGKVFPDLATSEDIL